MHPQGDWRWLRDLTNRLDRWARPSRDDRARLLPAGEVFRRLLAELERIADGPLARPMAENTIYQRVMMRTEALFGTGINPHAFRTIAATFLAESAPADALHARPLLGHRQAETTARHYIRANQLEASRTVTAALRRIRDA